MKETFIDILKSKTFDILIVAALLWVGVFIINRFVQAFLNGLTLLKNGKRKQLKALFVRLPVIQRPSALYCM